MTHERVLVTGGAGLIAGHCILQLLEQGYRVRTTVRSLTRESEVHAVLAEAGMVDGDNLSFVAADLTDDAGWSDAVDGCDYVLHVASPVRFGKTKNEDEIISPARDGALRVLRAARDAGVRRVVLTSAFHAVGFGHGHLDHVFTEDDWSPLHGPGVDAYGRSKILMPGYPNVWVPIVDVRDVAAAHMLAMTSPAAAGERFLLASGPVVAMKEIGATLREHFGDAAPKVPTRRIPNIVIRLAAHFNDEARSAAADLDYVKKISNDKARRVLGWEPRPASEAVIAAAESLIAKSHSTS
ncbi:NAD-dependent epimerase/dehydratase family protein [Rhodococcus sp. T7]|uniref:NAD-dependent epimerase/dehydratase family protein n=1 Tax=Rhodococcus sp. T7 TaxID=627444 RepID=UPI00135AFC2B|nr:NAD-dependent epimerase/dehydratase family protein [Rhodococcus sp. T7]KAF0959437.1 hypothetical protein MLGJGCBP_07473 [Rhodococcus sp. T7]